MESCTEANYQLSHMPAVEQIKNAWVEILMGGDGQLVDAPERLLMIFNVLDKNKPNE